MSNCIITVTDVERGEIEKVTIDGENLEQKSILSFTKVLEKYAQVTTNVCRTKGDVFGKYCHLEVEVKTRDGRYITIDYKLARPDEN